jgi:protein subunit release factor A
MPLAERIQDNTDEMTECLNHVKELEAKWKDSSENEEKKRLRSDITATSAEIKILSSTLDALLALQGNERDENVGN